MIYKMRYDCRENPLGAPVDGEFSWLISTPGKEPQVACEIRVAKTPEALATDDGLVWTSGRRQTSVSTGLAYGGPELASAKRYYWQARVWLEGRDEPVVSDVAYFETALTEADWKAEWVSSPYPRHGEYCVTEFKEEGLGEATNKDELNRPVLFRSEFAAAGEVASARLYSTAHGVYEAFLNGHKVTDELFAPGFTSYDKLLYFQSYDVTPYVAEGANVLGVVAADGWYSGFVGGPGIPCEYGEDLSVLWQLEVEYADGSRQTVCSDGSCLCGHGGLIYSDLFIGEKRDLRLDDPAWCTAGFDASGWEPAVVADFGCANLAPAAAEPIRAHGMLPAVQITTSPAAETIIDFGQVLAGRAVITVETAESCEVVLDHTEVLTREGNFINNVMGDNKDQQNVFITCGTGEETYCPQFSFQGFRYVRVSSEKSVRVVSAYAEPIYSDLCETGSFSCDNALLNQLQHNVEWSQRGNFCSIPTDCPQRERMGWTADIQVFAPTAAFNMDTRLFLRSWMRNLRLDQLDDGQVPIIVPFLPAYRDTVCGHLGQASCTGWGDAVAVVPWVQYQLFNDRAALEKNYGAMCAWAALLESQAAEGVPERYAEGADEETLARQKYLLNTGFRFGDWLLPSVVMSDGAIDMFMSSIVTRELVGAVYYAYTVQLMEAIARELGHDDDAARFAEQHDRIRDAFLAEYVAEDGSLITETPFQGIYVMALKFGLYTDEVKPKLIERLVDMIEKNDGLHDCGFLSVPFLLDVLVDNGQAELAYRLLFETRCPSWLYEVSMGATTTWEAWQALLPDGSPTNVSYNHYANGCVGDFIYRRIGGLAATKPGYQEFCVRPDYRCGLQKVELAYDSVNGRIEVAWRRAGNKVRLEVEVPQNTSAQVWTGEGFVPVSAGHHSFDVPAC